MADTDIRQAPNSDEELPLAMSPSLQFLKRFWRRKSAVIGLLFIVFILIVAVVGPAIVPYDPSTGSQLELFKGPSPAHIWGTDEYGRDVFSRVVAGTQLSISTALTASILGAACGVILGLIAGFVGGAVDWFIMRICDVMFAFPGILLAIAVVAIIGPGVTNIMIGVAVFTVPSFTRIIRGSVLEVRAEPYIEAAKSVGCSRARIMFVHIFPGTMSALIVNFSMSAGNAILAASTLSFLGFGAGGVEPEWGAILSGAILSTERGFLESSSHLVLLPGLAIVLTVLAFNLFGDGLRDSLDPELN